VRGRERGKESERAGETERKEHGSKGRELTECVLGAGSGCANHPRNARR
jgi:hypothetical protein